MYVWRKGKTRGEVKAEVSGWERTAQGSVIGRCEAVKQRNYSTLCTVELRAEQEATWEIYFCEDG